MHKSLLLAFAAISAFASQPRFRFEANLGQADPSVRYIARGKDAAVAFTDGAIRSGGVTIFFPGSNQAARWSTIDQLTSTSSYFIGADPAQWVRDAPHFSRLIRRGLYRGIDVAFYATGDQLEFDFIVAPQSDPRQIRLEWPRNTLARTGDSGELIVETAATKLILHLPAVYQTTSRGRVQIPARFAIDRSGVHFDLGRYDREFPLTIDPTVESWSFAGGSAEDRITVVTPGLIAGVTNSPELAPAGTNVRGKDVFVWSGQQYTLYGGSGDEEPTAATQAGNIWVLAGWTSSKDFPLLGSNNLQRNFGGGATDGFVIVGPYLSYSTYLGGTGADRILAIAADPANHTLDFSGYFVAGETDSPDFPTRAPLQAGLAGGKDGFITRINAQNAISHSTYWGGSGDDAILALDATASSCWFAGRSNSTNLPLEKALQKDLAGATDGFLGRLDTSTNALVFASYFGGSGDDEFRALRIAPDGWISAGGVTDSADFPVQQAFRSTPYGDLDVWIGRFHPSGGPPSFVTYLGGSGHDELSAIAHDGNGDLYVAGWTNSSDLPVRDALQDRAAGSDDGFMARLDRNGIPQMVTYVGGAGADRLRGIAVASDSRILAGGESDSDSIPALISKPKTVAAGRIDGWLVTFRADGIYARDVLLGKDLQTTFNVTVSGLENAGLPITIRSTDPALVTVNNAVFASRTSVTLDGHADSGHAELIVSVPGLAARHVSVTLRPSHLVNGYADEVPILLDTSTTLSFATGITHPESGEVIFQRTAQNTDLGISYVSDQPEVVQVRGNSVEATVRAVAEGTARVSIISSRFPVLGARDVRVRVVRKGAPVLQLEDAAVGRYLQTALPINIAPGSLPISGSFDIRFTSEDSSKLLVSASSGEVGAESVVIHYVPSSQPPILWVQGRAFFGVVRIRAEVEGAPPVYVRVAVAASVIAIATPLETSGSGRGYVSANLATTSAVLDLQSTQPRFAVVATLDGAVPPGFPAGNQLPSPESPNRFFVESSDPSVIAAAYEFRFDLTRPSWYVAFYAPLLKPGTSQLSVRAPGFDAVKNLTVTVRRAVLPLAVSETTLGKDLQTSIPFRIPYDFPQNLPLTVTSSDPTRLRVGQYQSEENAQTSLRLGPAAAFWITALADSGDVTVNIAAPGFDPLFLVVHLAPTVYRLTPASLTATRGESVNVQVTATVSGIVQDYSRTHRQNVRPQFAIVVSDPNLISDRSPTFSINGNFT